MCKRWWLIPSLHLRREARSLSEDCSPREAISSLKFDSPAVQSHRARTTRLQVVHDGWRKLPRVPGCNVRWHRFVACATDWEAVVRKGRRRW